MKLNRNKFALIFAVTISSFSIVGKVLFRYLFAQEAFVPYIPPQTAIQRTYPIGISLLGIILIFAISFIGAWFFVTIYDRLTTKK